MEKPKMTLKCSNSNVALYCDGRHEVKRQRHCCISSVFSPWFLLTLVLLLPGVVTAEYNLETRFPTSLKNLTVRVGEEAKLDCPVENLGDYNVAWFRYDSSRELLLTVDLIVLTRDPHISVVKEQGSFSLVIADVTLEYQGRYKCQISTSPVLKIFGYISVHNGIPANVNFSITSAPGIHGRATGTSPTNYPPGRVVDLNATNEGENVILTFTASAEDYDIGASSYVLHNVSYDNDIHVKLNVSEDAGRVISTTVPQGQCDKMYNLTVIAVDIYNLTSQPSNQVTVMYACQPHIDKPTGLSAVAISGIIIGSILFLKIIINIVYI